MTTIRSHFEPITLSFTRPDKEETETYDITSDRVFGAIQTIEDFVTMKELSDGISGSGRVSMTRLAAAYAAVLRYAGAKEISDEDVYVSMFRKEKGSNAIIAAINGLLGLMIPPAAVKAAEKTIKEETGKPGEHQGRVAQIHAASSSRRPTR